MTESTIKSGTSQDSTNNNPISSKLKQTGQTLFKSDLSNNTQKPMLSASAYLLNKKNEKINQKKSDIISNSKVTNNAVNSEIKQIEPEAESQNSDFYNLLKLVRCTYSSHAQNAYSSIQKSMSGIR